MAASLATYLSKYLGKKGNALERVHAAPPVDEDGESSIEAWENEEDKKDEDLASKLSVWGSVRYLTKIFWEFARGAKLHTVLIRICPDEIRQIKESQASESQRKSAISKNDIAVAYSWILMRKLQEKLGYLENSDRCDKARMLFAADLRVKNRLQQLSDDYFGNAVLAVDVTGPEHMSLLQCATAVRRVVSDLKQTKTKR